MSPMFNACMQNAGNAGPPNHLGPPQPNGPPPPQNFYTPNPPAPHQFNSNQAPPHPINNFNNNQIRNIAPRPPNFYSTFEYRIYEFTKRLAERPDNVEHPWWDQVISEFFDDHSTFTIQFSLDDGPKQHTIGRTLIPRYFRTMFEDGVHDLSIRLKRPFLKELPNRLATLECEQCTLITQHGKPGYNKQQMMMHYPGMDPMMMKENKEIGLVVSTEGRLALEFIMDDHPTNNLHKIKSWNFTTTNSQEYVLKNLVAVHAQQDASMLEQLTKNVTRQGLTNATVNYLALCVLLEPMQLIMSRHKEMDNTSPRDCLKNVLYNKWQTNVCGPQEQQRPQNKRRKRKASTPNNATTGGSKKKNSAQMSPGTPSFPLATQDVMVVGEPSLMGGEFGDEDERVITRLENNQYESGAVPTNGLDENDDFGASLGVQPPNGGQQQQQPPPNQQQPNQSPLNQPPQQINPSPGNPMNNGGQQPGQWSGPSPHNQQAGVNGNNSNPPSIGPSSIEDKKQSPISQ